MEAKKITPEQMEKLFRFTRQHFVEYYDLQAELADHLANAIEERWVEQPGLSFDEALRLEFKKFGIFGFSDIVEQRQNVLFKKYYKVVWQEFRSILSLPVIGGIFLVGLVIYKAVLLWTWLYAVLMLVFFIVSAARLWRLRKQYKQRLEETGKKWLLEEVIFNCGGFGVLLNLPLQVSQHVYGAASPEAAAFMAFILMLLFIYDYIVLFRLPSRAGFYLRKVYPEYAMEN